MIDTEERPEPQAEAVTEESQDTGAEVIPWPGMTPSLTAQDVLAGRLGTIDFLITKELDEKLAHERAAHRALDRLNELGHERKAIKQALKALDGEESV